MSPPDIIKADVVILGAGLAGLRAAWSALAAAPDLNVVIVSQAAGPSGSSFTNINNRLGIQVCLNDRERGAFIRDVIRVAAPGYIDSSLVEILAAESEPRFRDLEQLGFSFDKDAAGQYARVPGCFSPHSPRCYIFSNLAAAYTVLKRKLISLNGHFLEGWDVQGLITDRENVPGRVCGVLLRKTDGPLQLAINTKMVVCALGGPASLFAFNVGGIGTPGYAQALLKRAGVSLVNVKYLQFLWHSLPPRQFWPIQQLEQSGVAIRGKDNIVRRFPEALRHLADDRRRHCPVAHGMPDEAMDRYLIQYADEAGTIRVFLPDTGWLEVAMMAHAGNGGAKIDKNGWTGVFGLNACGECAGGMHGANRLGGAMVLATQVFGARAGCSAAQCAMEAAFAPADRFKRLIAPMLPLQTEDEGQWHQGLNWVKQGLQAAVLPGRRAGRDNFIRACHEKLADVGDWRLRLVLETAIIISGGD